MNESAGWRATILGLTGNTPVAGQRVHILRDILDDDVRGSGHAALGAFALVGELPPESRLLLVPGVAARLGHPSLAVRRAAWATLRLCVPIESVRTSVRDEIERLVATGDKRDRRNLLGALKRWLQVVEAPVNLESASLIGPALLALSLLPVATAGSGHQDRPRVTEVERWLGDAHILLREASVRWLASEGCDRDEALERMLRVYTDDRDPLVSVAALRGWARRTPPNHRDAHFTELLDERRWLSRWRGPKATTVPLTPGQQITMVGGAVVEALADLARGDTARVERLLPELEASALSWPVKDGGLIAFMDLTGSDRPPADRDRLFEMIDSFQTSPVWWLARRVGAHTFDVGLSQPVPVRGATGDLLLLEAHPDRWVISARWREGTVAARHMGERFPLGPVTDDPAVKGPAEVRDRGWFMICACTATASLLRGRVTPDQGDRLRRLLAEHAIRLHRIAGRRGAMGSDGVNPVTSLRDRLTREILSGEPRPDAFEPGRGDVALARISASGLRSLPGADGDRFIAASEQRLETIACEGPPHVRALAAFVLAIHRRKPSLPPGARPLAGDEVGLEAMMFVPLDEAERLAAEPSGRDHFAACFELVARATVDPRLPLPSEALFTVQQVIEPLLADGAPIPSAWTTQRERLMLRLMLAWAQAPVAPRPELRPVLLWVLSDAPAPVLQLLLDAWDPAKGRWTDDRELVGRLAARISATIEFASWRHLDSRQVGDAVERPMHLRRLLAGLTDAGRLVPWWLEMRKTQALPEHRAKVGRLRVEEHGGSSWHATGPDDHAFVHRTAGAIDLPCVIRTEQPVPAAPYRLTRDDVIVAQLRDAQHAGGWISALRFIGLEARDAIFRLESDWLDEIVRLAEGELVDSARAPIRWEGLERGTKLAITTQLDGDIVLLVCTRRDETIPRLRRAFRPDGHLAIVHVGARWRFDLPALHHDRLPIPRLDAPLERALAGLADGARYKVRLVDGWDPDVPVRSIRVTAPRDERRYDGVTPEMLDTLLHLEPGAVLDGSVLESSAGQWLLDGLPLQLTLGAEYLGPDAVTASGTARPALSPPLRVVTFGPGVPIGRVAAGEPRAGIVVRVAGSVSVIRTLEGEDLTLETDLDLAPADRVEIDLAGEVTRFRGDIVACPIVAEESLEEAMGQAPIRNIRFLAPDRRRGGWLAASDVHTLVWIPGWIAADVNVAPLVDVQVRRAGDGFTLTALAATGLAARVGTAVELEPGDGVVTLRLRPPLVLPYGGRPPKQAFLGPLEVEIEEAGDARIAQLRPPDLSSVTTRGRLPLSHYVRRGPVEVEGWMWREGDRWRVDARQVDSDGALVDIQPTLLEMPAEELSWDPLGRWARDNFRGRVRVWWDDGFRVSARRTAPQRLVAWLQRLGISRLGDRPLIYAGDVDDELRAAWGLQGKHYLLEYAPGAHLALQPAELGLAHAAAGDRLLRYRVVPARPDRPLRLEVLAVEVEFANRIAAFGSLKGVLPARVAGGKVTSIADPDGDAQVEPTWDTELEGDAPSDHAIVFVRFKERRGSRLVFTVVPPERVLDPGNLLLVEAVDTSGFAQRARLHVRPVDGTLDAEIGANDYSIDRMRLAEHPPAAGARFLAKVRPDSDPEAPRLSCRLVPQRPPATLIADEGAIHVLVAAAPDPAGNDGLLVEVQPGWTVRIPRSVLAGGAGYALGDRLVLARNPRAWRIAVQARLPGPWDALPPATPVFVLPWGSKEHRIREWHAEQQTVSGHIVGATAAVVRLWMATEPHGEAEPLPARLGAPGPNQESPADQTRVVGEWIASRLELRDQRICLDDEEVPWSMLTAREAAAHAELATWLRALHWRAEPGAPQRRALGSGVFIHRSDDAGPPVCFGLDHLLEQFVGPRGQLDRERRFVVAGLGDAGLTVEIHPGREVRLPWGALVPATPWRDGMGWDPDGFGRGDVVVLGRGEPGTLVLLDHEIGKLRLLTGAVVPFEPRTDDDVIGPPPLSVLACLAGSPRHRCERVKVTPDELVPWGTSEPGDLVFLVPGPRGPVVHGEPELRWSWEPDPLDPLGGDADGPDGDVIAAFGAFACLVLGRRGRSVLLGRRPLIGPLIDLPPNLVRTARPVRVRDSVRLLVLVAGIPWQIDRDAWCAGRVNLNEPAVRALASRMMLDVAVDADGRLSALAPRAPITGEVDAAVVAHPNGVLLRVAGRLLFLAANKLGWADLDLDLVRHLFPVGTSIRLAIDEDGELGVDQVGAIAQDLTWLRSRGGPVLVQPVWIEGDDAPVRGLAVLRSGLFVNVDDDLDVDAPAWVWRLRTERRQLTLVTRRPEQVWDLPALDPDARARDLGTTAGSRTSPSPPPVALHGRNGDDATARVRRLWALVRDQAHRTMLWPGPRHLVQGSILRMLDLGDALASLPADGDARIEALHDLCSPDMHTLHHASAEAVRCWLAWLQVGADGEKLEQALGNLRQRITQNRWSGLGVRATSHVVAAGLSFARGDVAGGLDALLTWNGELDSADPCVEAAAFWRGWLRGQRWSGPGDGVGAFLASLEHLAREGATDADVRALEARWASLGVTWRFDDVEIQLIDRSAER